MADSTRIASHGRGGAGNIGKDDPNDHVQPNDLVTPTLKSDHYTTGRGGTGNMAKNDPNHPELARAAQDVDTPVHRDENAPRFYGRGGAANFAKPGEQQGDSPPRKSGEAKRSNSQEGKGQGFVEKGKEFLHKLKK
ncbi:hypothetical protein P154DRAFT_525848 [Amniculicola lignicola CBS 123094]|uniref:Uncharacterized protein n=1 Tax=Amniculicola lignicola CBS 123094 TaxID=1392246 RepID=A0A6A5W2X5_9PLEO|nr:hypothetical protein P154DRAFT_525848 [Amniculicola lignicola CBS 123094]